jgi:Flp pilus assembly pilin Flp
MLRRLRPLLLRWKSRLLHEAGQDLVEYALLIAILSFCAIAAEQNVATSISGAFTNIAGAFNTEV